MPSGEVFCITVERWLGDGRDEPAAVAALDGLRPHLARAGLLSARLGLERARTMVATLEAIGLPAAVLTASGRALAVNGLVDALSNFLLPAAHGRLSLAHPSANLLLQEALAASQAASAVSVRSIPVPSAEGRDPLIVHLLPLRGAAHDIFSGGAVLLVAAALSKSSKAPDLAVLHGLFDLSPAEARLAAALASGRSLKEAAVDGGIRFSTARSYLESVFRKTATRQQSQLVSLLKSTQPLAAGQAARKVALPSNARSPP